MNIAEFLSTILTWDWLKITMGHAEGLDWSGVTCACDQKVLIGYNPIQHLKACHLRL